jgi:hypothetical protein
VREHGQDRLDQVLDDALASYGEAPESEGLARRVLAQVTERTTRTRPARRLVMAIGAAAAAVCCLFWWETPKMTVDPLPASIIKPAMRKTEDALTAQAISPRDFAVVLPRATKSGRTLTKPAEPKLARFPTPSPMTSKEWALLRLVSGDAKNIPRELTHFGEPIEPIQLTAIELTAIEIKPLE